MGGIQCDRRTELALRRVLGLADAIVNGKGHGHGRMREHLRDNVGDAVAQRITAAGFTVEPTRMMPLRIGGTVGIEVARPSHATAR